MNQSPSDQNPLLQTKHAKGRLSSLDAPVSPPGRRNTRQVHGDNHANEKGENELETPNLAAIEAGQAEVMDHLSVISSQLKECTRPPVSGVPRLQIQNWINLYKQNLHPNGRHFVIHQHDHPIAGPHYDLRLQFSDSSSVSWSIMYGLPGDPNSRRLNRNATETRVHCLWNHLIETASARTGSLIIWDTGEYEILPYEVQNPLPETDDSRSDISSGTSVSLDEKTDSEKLRQAFQNRKIRLRLHGSRLPPNYTIILRLDRSSQFRKSSVTPRKRRRRNLSSKPSRQPSTSSSDSSSPSRQTSSTGKLTPLSSDLPDESSTPAAEHSDVEDNIDYQIRANNAYPGSTNSIGSIHQRRWFVTLDRVNSGFTDIPGTGPAGRRWIRMPDPKAGETLGFEPFYVRGPDAERSVVTGRLGKEVLKDEGVESFVPRRGWRAVLE
ncbi:hypothetical protein BDV59DRAFT_76248 [Aspergillus ambiguus]|uniref:uncharacterized protein n=1 Tax=Aspergillus ambiguus TaxID=176160 RepID=UPI003CCCB118